MKYMYWGLLSLLLNLNLSAQSSKVPFLTAEEQLKTMQLQEGYSMELVVGDPPLLVDDEFVAEERGPIELPHEGLGEFVEGVRKDDDLKAFS